jgi:23S rRNA (adenine2030-N6)-methyltransferase
MLSYRHSYHAGNYADVLKHSVLIHILEYLKKKDKPYCYVDTHAGAGMYSLRSEQAVKTNEYQQGIGALWQQDDLPPTIAEYRELIQSFNEAGQLAFYPGSPLIAMELMRKQDRLFLYELHNTEINVLQEAIKRDQRVTVLHKDGFKDCLRLMPPQQRRGLVLIDPSYEIKTDYQQVVDMLIQLYKRFATGTYALWYPVVERQRINELEENIAASQLSNVQLFELAQTADSDQYGMNASGMIIVNPPWTLTAEMEQVLPYLAKHLGIGGQGSYRIKQLKAE